MRTGFDAVGAETLEAEAALRSSGSPEEYAEVLTVIVDEATRLGRLADQLLQLSRQDAGIVRGAHESVQLDALLQDVAEQLRPLARERGVSLDEDQPNGCE